MNKYQIYFRKYSFLNYVDFDEKECPISTNGEETFERFMSAVKKFNYYPVVLIERTYGADKTFRVTLELADKNKIKNTDNIKDFIYYKNNINSPFFNGRAFSESKSFQYYFLTTPISFRIKAKRKTMFSLGEIAEKFFNIMRGKYFGGWDSKSNTKFPNDELELELLSLV